MSIIPNFITLLNGVFGLLAIYAAYLGNLNLAAIFILFAMVLDSLDGYVARLLKVDSKLGMLLDNVCDLTTFAGAAAIVIFVKLNGLQPDAVFINLGLLFLYVFCLTTRLMDYIINYNMPPKNWFRGMPSPVAAYILMIALLLDLGYIWIYSLLILVSLMMVTFNVHWCRVVELFQEQKMACRIKLIIVFLITLAITYHFGYHLWLMFGLGGVYVFSPLFYHSKK